MNVMCSISVNVHMNVMCNMNVCYASIIVRYSLYIGEKHSEGKDVGEIFFFLLNTFIAFSSILYTIYIRYVAHWVRRHFYKKERGSHALTFRDGSLRRQRQSLPAVITLLCNLNGEIMWRQYVASHLFTTIKPVT